MKIIFRTDASIDIGTGHVMRCLTLADVLCRKGAECRFICREHTGHLIELIRARGYEVYALPQPEGALQDMLAAAPESEHARWLGTSQELDASSCFTILRKFRPDWLVVDHYALDRRWETAQRPHCSKIMVIDDLADRLHDCDLLLDQTFGRQPEEYQPLVPEYCTILCGSRYALLRPEFAQWRPYSLKRRKKKELRHLLITMGGVDRGNATGMILDALTTDCLPEDCRISVVMGRNAPWLNQVRQQAGQLPWSTDVRVDVTDMARLMADSDLAIGAAGATSWERCCLGLPTLLMVLADNQIKIAHTLFEAQAASVLDFASCSGRLRDVLRTFDGKKLFEMSGFAADVCDGSGSAEVVAQLKRVQTSCV